MNSKAKALNNKLLAEFFSSKSPKIVGKGIYLEKLGKSKSGPCKFCRSMKGTHRIGGSKPLPPHHPNCKCTVKTL